MTYFGPTRAEMKFRLTVSVLGLLIFVAAILLRGLPGEPENLQLAGLVFLFLALSAGLSGVKLKRLSEE